MSRLTAYPRPVAVDALKVAPLAFRRLGEHVLITGEGGEHAVLSPKDFERFLSGGVKQDEALWKDLQAKGFVKDYIDFATTSAKVLERKLLVWEGPCVHRFAASDAAGTMSFETARAAVDRAFSSRSSALTFEVSGFNGAAQWPVVQFLVRYARTRADKAQRVATIVVDVPELDQTEQDVLLKQKAVLRFGWNAKNNALTRAIAATSGEHEGFAPKPQVRVVVERPLLGKERETVEALQRLGVDAVDFVPGDVTPEEFVASWKASFDWIVKAGLKGKKLKEARGLAAARRIVGNRQWGDAQRVPVDRVAYDSKGGLYLFDEGDGNSPELFFVGPAATTTFTAALTSAAARAGLNASTLESQPLCSQCAFRPFCTANPAASVESQGTLWGRTPSSPSCRVHMGVFDHLFARLQEWEVREKLFKAWLA